MPDTSRVLPPDAPAWLRGSAVDLAHAIRAGAVTCRAAVATCLARIDAVNPALNAVVARRTDAAMAEAEAADRLLATGRARGPLHGVPITIKDSFDTAGLVTTAGTLGRRAHVPSADATVVARLKAAGAIVLGKTNTPELTLAYEANNLVYGMTRNPHDLARGTGGSSGGAAAIVAACGAFLDVGSDTAGSIRFPAHCCGVAGLKPTTGRVPRTGHIIGGAGLAQWLTCIGPIARRVADLEVAFDLIAGPDARDPHIVPVPRRPAAAVDVRGLRVALLADTPLSTTSPEVRAVVTHAADVLARAGLHVEEAQPPAFDRPFAFFPRMFGADGAEGLEAFVAALGTATVSPQLQGALHLNRPYKTTAAGLEALVYEIDAWRTEALAFMERFDIVLAPAAADVAPLPVEHWTDPAVAWPPAIFSYLVPFNFSGQPVVAVPAGVSGAGLPIGVQVGARLWREDVALRVAGLIQDASSSASMP